MALLDQIVQTTRQHRMLDQDVVVVLAVSGGPDSLAMMHALCSLRGQALPHFAGHVAHLHHGMRPLEGDRDAAFVREQAELLGLPCHADEVDVPGDARALGIGVEEAGRRARYAFLGRVAAHVGATRVATAHHADDNVETVLMRVARGVTRRALAGIPPVRPLAPGSAVNVIRPMLACRRAQVLAFLEGRDLRGQTDSTNLQRDSLRNQVRLDLLPLLEQRLAPGITESVLLGIQRFRKARAALVRRAQHAVAEGPVRCTPEHVSFGASWLAGLDDALASEIVHQIVQPFVAATDALTTGHHQDVLRLCRSHSTTGRVTLPGALTVRRQYGRCAIEPRKVTPADSLPVAAPVDMAGGETPLPGFLGSLTVAIQANGPGVLDQFLRDRTPRMAMVDADCLCGELCVRAWRAGDRMRPLGAPGRRKLQDIFTDLRVPRLQRHRTPLLTVDDRPIWIIGHCMAEDVKVSAQTRRVARIVFRPSD